MKNKSKPLSIQDLENAAQQISLNYGMPDTLFMPSGLHRTMMMMGINVGTSETNAKIRKHFTGIGLHPDNTDMRDFEVMTAAAKAFGRIGLDKDRWPLGYTIDARI